VVNVITADYGFTKTTSGQETRYLIQPSTAAKNVARVRNVSLYVLLFSFCVIPGSCAGGDANSFSVGLFTTIVWFVVILGAIKFIGRARRKEQPSIVLTPTTISVGKEALSLKDARDWRISNSRDERTEIIYSGTQALTRDMAVAASYYIGFSYGQNSVVVAANLSKSQADALFQDIMSTLQGYGHR
jgi:hypothetical protein